MHMRIVVLVFVIKQILLSIINLISDVVDVFLAPVYLNQLHSINYQIHDLLSANRSHEQRLKRCIQVTHTYYRLPKMTKNIRPKVDIKPTRNHFSIKGKTI